MKIKKPQYIDGVAYFCTSQQFEELKKAVDTFKKFSPDVKGYEHLYDIWQDNMKAVIVLQEAGDENGIYAEYGVYIMKKDTFKVMDHVYLASLLFHESRHVEQDINNPTIFQEESYMKNLEWTEEDAYKAQRAFLEWVGDKNDLKDLDEDFESKWWLEDGNSSEEYNKDDVVPLKEHDKWIKIVDKHLDFLESEWYTYKYEE